MSMLLFFHPYNRHRPTEKASSSFRSSLSGLVERTYPIMDRSESQFPFINEFFILYFRTLPKQCHTHTHTHKLKCKCVCVDCRKSDTRQTMENSTESPQYYPYWWTKRIGGRSYHIWLEGRSMNAASCLCECVECSVFDCTILLLHPTIEGVHGIFLVLVDTCRSESLFQYFLCFIAIIQMLSIALWRDVSENR